MTSSDRSAQVVALARAGNIPGAIAEGERLLLDAPDPGLATFVGVLCCRDGQFERGIAHLSRAVQLAPNEPIARIELGRALLSTSANAEARDMVAAYATVATPIGREMQRILARALMQTGDAEASGPLFTQLISADPNDFESWEGLGLVRTALADKTGAVEALEQAVRLRPTSRSALLGLARAYLAQRDYERALDATQRALALEPNDPAVLIEQARALVGLSRFDEALAALNAMPATLEAEALTELAEVEAGCRAFKRAEAHYRDALDQDPELVRAWVGLGKLLERTNRTADLFELLAAADLAGIAPDRMALLNARALRADDRMTEALAAAQAAPEDDEPAARLQLIGDIADRLGDADTAFDAFSRANRILLDTTADSRAHAETFRANFQSLTTLVSPQWYRSWRERPPFSGRAPLFIFGFPRSGTTLIDTMLAGHPDAVILEEEPTIDNLAKKLGPFDRLATLSDREIAELRDFYFAEVARIIPEVGTRLIVDKNPLGLSSTPLLYFLFPDARFVFVERHPLDVVLSCFIMSSRLNANVASFFEFEGTAKLYDSVLSYWTKCRESLPFKAHHIRYETLIANPEEELRSLAAFAGLEWTDNLLAHEENAARRDYIGSPSYAQVAQPLYTRARGRWLRYRRHMAVVEPILAPWIDRLGYDMGEVS